MGKLSWKPTGKSLVTDEHCPHSIFPLLLAIFVGGASSLLMGNYQHFNQGHLIVI